MGGLDDLITDEYLDDEHLKDDIDEDEDDLTFDDEIETEYEKRGCTFHEYKNFVSGM